MTRAVKPAQLDHLPPVETPPALMQPVFANDGKIVAMRPIPSLAALEQEGGPEIDGRLELPTRELWTTRMSPYLFDD